LGDRLTGFDDNKTLTDLSSVEIGEGILTISSIVISTMLT
jgi:hypothetical protein